MGLEESLAVTLGAAGFDGVDPAGLARGTGGDGLPTERRVALLALDFDRVQDTVLASPRPVTILGASSMIRKWDDELRQGERVPPGATVLFAGGGNAVLLVPASDEADVDRIAGGLLEDLRRKTLGTATAAWRLVSPRELVRGPEALEGDTAALKKLGLSPGEGGFGQWLGLLSRDLRRKKGTDRDHEFLSEPVGGGRCTECALRPQRDREGRCERCAEYREAGGTLKGERGQAKTFDQVLGYGRKIAFVFVDGRGIAGELAGLRTIREYFDVSAALREAFDIRGRARDLGLRDEHYVPVMSGGDDLLFVMAAAPRAGTDVLTLTASLLEEIERRLDDGPLRGRLGAGAGVVISSGLPADFAFDLAHRLCEAAKGRLAASAAGDRSALDFAVVASGAMFRESGLEHGERDVALGTGKTTEKVRLSQRPYTLSRFRRLLDLAKRMDDQRIGRSALVALRDALDQSPEAAALSWAYQLGRSTKLREVLGVSLNEPVSELSEWLFRPAEGGRGWATAVPDLVEVLRVRRGR